MVVPQRLHNNFAALQYTKTFFCGDVIAINIYIIYFYFKNKIVGYYNCVTVFPKLKECVKHFVGDYIVKFTQVSVPLPAVHS